MHTKSPKRKLRQRASDFIPHGKIAQNVMQQRADHLATRIIEKSETLDTISYIRFHLGANDQYGIIYQYATEVISHVMLTQIPWAPHFIAGAINRRGALIAVLDLKQLFYYQKTEHNKDTYVIVVSAKNMTVGFLANSITGSDFYHPKTLDTPLPSASMVKLEYIIGLHKGATAIINVEAIMLDIKSQMDKKV